MPRRLKKEKALDLWRGYEEKYKDAESSMLSKINTWMERAAMFRGMQTVRRDGVLYTDQEPTGEAREVQNFIRSFVRAAVASRLGAFPNPEVPAASSDEKSLARARATERLLKSFVDDGCFDKEEVTRALTWACIVGGAWIKPTWDPNAGRLVEAEDVVDEVTNEDGTTTIREAKDPFGFPIQKLRFEGRIKLEYVDTVDGIPDPTAKRFREMRYWCHRKEMSQEEMEATWPRDYFGEKTEGRFGEPGKNSAPVTRDFIAGLEENNRPGQSSKDNEKVETVEYWERPSEAFPNGVLCIWSGAILLYLGPCIYVPARIPAVLVLGDNIVPSGFYADGTVEDLIPLQRTLNRVETKKREYVDNVATPHIFNPLGSRVDPDMIGQVPGQVIDHAPGLRPSVMEIPNLPQAAFQIPEELIQRMKEISGYQDVTQGASQSGDISGRAIAFLRENEQNIRQADKSIYQRAMLDIFRHMMMLAKQFYEDGRMIRTLGSNNEWEFNAFKDEDYDWFVDLAPELESGAPNSRALRYAEITESASIGLFNDEIPGMKEARMMLGFDNANSSTTDPYAQDTAMARRENMQFVRGEQVERVREFHHDEIHLQEHNKVRNSTIYLEAPPEQQMAFDQHCMMHEQQLAMKMQNFGQKQMLMQGQPPPGPAPEGGPGGAESPMDGGHGAVGTDDVESQDEFVANEVAQGSFEEFGS